jgi:AraC-like DNA-binding protein
VSADDLTDTHVDLETLWGTEVAQLRERLCAACNAAQRFHVLEQALIAHLFRPMEHHYAVRFALGVFLRADSDSTVRNVAKGLGVSQRRFIEVFAREVELTPKLFCRLRRFQRALSSLGHTSATDWSKLVVDCGYSDQSHFIHDFRDFSGLKPTEYLAQRSPKVMENHVPMQTR